MVRVFVLRDALIDGECSTDRPPRNEKAVGSIPQTALATAVQRHQGRMANPITGPVYHLPTVKRNV